MARFTYSHDELGGEIQAPWGYYQPQEEDSLEYAGRRVIYTLGSACIEVSCCGNGSWNYARVEGYVTDDDAAASSSSQAMNGSIELESVEAPDQRTAIARLLEEKHPGVRVEFR